MLDLTGRARPDLASLTLASLDFLTGPSLNAPDLVRALACKMKQNGIKPELECFDFGMVNAANTLIAQHEIDPPTTLICCSARATRCRPRLVICPP